MTAASAGESELLRREPVPPSPAREEIFLADLESRRSQSDSACEGHYNLWIVELFRLHGDVHRPNAHGQHHRADGLAAHVTQMPHPLLRGRMRG